MIRSHPGRYRASHRDSTRQPRSRDRGKARYCIQINWMHDVARRSRKQTRAKGKKRIRANRCRPSWRSPQTRTRTERTIENPFPRSEAKPEDAGKGRCVSGSGNAGAMVITDEGCRIPSRPGLISTATYPPADIARWREGTFPHSNDLNAERRSMATKANQDQRSKPPHSS